MFLTHRRRQRGNPNLICSPKCAAIVAPTPLHRDLLIQTLLDPHVRSVHALEPRLRGDAGPRQLSLVLGRDDGRFVLEIGAGAQQDGYFRARSPHRSGLPLIEIRPDEIRREPRLTNARQVWSHWDDDPPLRHRERIIDVLSVRGPQSIAERERWTGLYDPVRTVCAMACADMAERELGDVPLGPRTVVRARR